MNASRTWQRPYQAYLFDLDGTLIDTVPDINAALNHTLQVSGFDTVNESLTRHWIGHGARVLIEQALAHADARHPATSAALKHQQEAMLEIFLTHYRANLATLSAPYPKVLDSLTTLRARGAKLAVVTNKMAALTEPQIREIGMAEYFDLIISGDTAANPKPAPDPVLLCLAQLKVDASQALFVGDSETDVLAAQAASVAVVCVRDGYNHGQDVTQLDADGVIDTFEELI